MRSIIQCVAGVGMTWKLLSFATVLATAHIVCAYCVVLNSIFVGLYGCMLIHLLGGEATYNHSDGSPLLPDLMCTGTENYLSECSGYDLEAEVPEDYCVNQGSARCVEGKIYFSNCEIHKG